ncbi:hypothetical protein C8J56DRAFT_942018 [Mycena floridula]|nr:hypothetical protein C8J56DRAFT_942018 [Mycena floridula]
MGNVTAPILSHNRVNHVHHHNHYGAHSVDSDPDFTAVKFGDIFLEEEIRSSTTQLGTDRTMYQGRVMASPMLIHHYAKSAEKFEQNYRNHSSLARHPNILQLYGVCRSPRFNALVFHGYASSSYETYHKSLSSMEFVSHSFRIESQWLSAVKMLEEHGFQSVATPRYAGVDPRGNLILDNIGPYFRWKNAGYYNDHQHQMLTVVQDGRFVKEKLLEYYDFLASVYHYTAIDVIAYWETDRLVDAPFNIRHPRMDLPDYHAPNIFKPAFWCEGNRKQEKTIVVRGGIRLSILPDMVIRCEIPTHTIPNFRIWEPAQLLSSHWTGSRYIELTPFSIWASQAHHLMHDLPVDVETDIYHWWYFQCVSVSISGIRHDTHLVDHGSLFLFCRILCDGVSEDEIFEVSWSTDDKGHDIIPDWLIRQTFGITVSVHGHSAMNMLPPQLYPLLRDIHSACGFDPESTQMAEYLGIPLLHPSTWSSEIPTWGSRSEIYQYSDNQSDESEYYASGSGEILFPQTLINFCSPGL